MLADWLRTPEVTRWWGEPEAELALIAEDLGEPEMRQWIVEHDIGGTNPVPFAYAQAYRIAAWPQSHLRHLPEGTVAIDAFIGVPDMLARGHGSAFLHELAAMLIGEGASDVVIDPAAENLRACRAYTRAGFLAEAVCDTEAGPVAIMRFTPPFRVPSG